LGRNVPVRSLHAAAHLVFVGKHGTILPVSNGCGSIVIRRAHTALVGDGFSLQRCKGEPVTLDDFEKPQAASLVHWKAIKSWANKIKGLWRTTKQIMPLPVGFSTMPIDY